MQLVNTAVVKQYDGLKYSGDHQDAFHLAHLMRLGILPTGYIYPKAQRAVRDLLRRRMTLVRSASAQLISVQSQIWRSTGIRIKSKTLCKPDLKTTLLDGYTLQAANAGLAVYMVIQQEIKALDQSAYQAVKLTKNFEVLQTIKGIGKILGLTIMLETGDIHRFSSAGNFASYCRCVDSTRTSNGKKKGTGSAKAGTNTFLGRFQKRHIFQCVLSRWHNVFMREKRPKQMASSPYVRLPRNWQEPVG